MRLGELNLLLKKISTLKIVTEPQPNGKLFLFKNFGEIRNTLKPISQSTWFLSCHRMAEKFLPSHLDASIEVKITIADKSGYEEFITELKKRVSSIISILNEIVEHQEKNYINIKLPEHITTSTELIKELEETQYVLDKLLVNNGLRSTIKFKGFDVGTNWLVFEINDNAIETAQICIGFLIACTAIAHAALVKKKELLSDAAREMYEYTKPKASYEEAVNEIVSANIKKEVEALCERFNEKVNDNTPDFINTTTYGIKKMMQQLDKGTEYHASLNPPNFIAEENGIPSLKYNEMSKYLSSTKTTLAISSPNKPEE